MSTRRTNGNMKAAAGNMSRRTQSNVSADKAGPMLKGTTISFSSGATIADSGNGLAVFAAGQKVRVRGSTLNSRDYVVATSAAGSLTVTPAVVQTESAGAAITISQVQ